MLRLWLSPGGANLFQEIKQVCAEAEAEGKKLRRLSIGQPSGPALESARQKAAECTLSEDESWHEYQDNGCVPISDFAQRFVQAHFQTDIAKFGNQLGFMPIPGIKPMLPLVQLACMRVDSPLLVNGMTDPGYPVPQTWAGYLGACYVPFRTNPDNGFLPDFELERHGLDFNLSMLNFPHNPSGQIATREYWLRTCEFCVKNGVRLFNDGAYLALAHSDECCALAEVAPDFPELSWLEAYSASKAIANGTGWRVGAVVGSADFVNDLKTIKGNTDSGFFAPAAAGALYALEYDKVGIDAVRQTYRWRLNFLTALLLDRGLQLAVSPGAGFFTLWQAPKRAFGREMKDARDFNLMMIKETGIVGVHFHPYIRYAVCGSVGDWADEISSAFKLANVSY